MPELPDITVYIEALEARIQGATLQRIDLRNPFLLRSVEPPISACEGQRVIALRRLGKRIAIGFENDLWLVIHLMIAGRLYWYPASSKGKVRPGLAMFRFDTGLLTLTEAGTKRRASLHVVRGALALDDLHAHGLEVLDADAATFIARLRAENHTLKRALTDPRILSGIGNAYSDEILHAAHLSPLLQTRNLSDADAQRLFEVTSMKLREWTARLRNHSAGEFPEKVTAFHPEMAVHGRYGKPCPECATEIQRIRYAENETNYCPRCQTGGKVLADRSLSRLLKDDWPRNIEELERRR
ncbi:MAG: DNA-formamidopyrimidine glycosylase family protein [Steroidobacteraceae bacterium]